MLLRIVLAIIAVLALLESGGLVATLLSMSRTAPDTPDLVVLALLTAAMLGAILFALCLVGANVVSELRGIRLALTPDNRPR